MYYKFNFSSHYPYSQNNIDIHLSENVVQIFSELANSKNLNLNFKYSIL